MLCLDIKLVARLRGVTSGTTSSSASPALPTTGAASSSSSTSGTVEKSKFRKARRESGEIASSTTTSDSEEELLRPSVQEMIRRNRSRSVCVAAILPSLQLRQLHRRASHHVYVITKRLRGANCKSSGESFASFPLSFELVS